jgi:hypothetical protein
MLTTAPAVDCPALLLRAAQAATTRRTRAAFGQCTTTQTRTTSPHDFTRGAWTVHVQARAAGRKLRGSLRSRSAGRWRRPAEAGSRRLRCALTAARSSRQSATTARTSTALRRTRRSAAVSGRRSTRAAKPAAGSTAASASARSRWRTVSTPHSWGSDEASPRANGIVAGRWWGGCESVDMGSDHYVM